MGAATSKRDGVAFAARSEYHKWTLGDVQAAVERWLNVSRKAAKVSGCGVFQKFGVNKREFWEIFTDYTVLRGGAFLCLPVRLLCLAPRCRPCRSVTCLHVPFHCCLAGDDCR